MDQWFIICALYKWLKWNLKFTMSADLNVFIMSGWIYLYIPVPTLKWKKWIKSNKNWKRSISCTRKLPLLAADEKLKSHIIIIFFFFWFTVAVEILKINTESILKTCLLFGNLANFCVCFFQSKFEALPQTTAVVQNIGEIIPST